jgi:DNA-binding transcriptional LysR family regulator
MSFNQSKRSLSMLPDLDSLALFVRASDLKSLTKAADSSNISLAAASRRITLLEDRFGAILLTRSSRGVEVTPAGASLLANAKVLLIQMNQMQADMTDYAVGRKSALRIHANTSAISQFLPGDLANFSLAHPDVKLIILERWSMEIVRSVLAAEADIGIVVEGHDLKGLEIHPYRTDQLAVVTQADHPLTRKKNMTFLDVLDHDIVALESGSSMMRLLAEQAVIAQRTLQLRIEVRSSAAVCRIVESGLGVGLLPLLAAQALARNMRIAVRPLPEPWSERRMNICIRTDQAPNSAAKLLLKHLASCVSSTT